MAVLGVLALPATARTRLAQVFILQLLFNAASGRQFDSIDNCRARVIAANATTPALNLTFILTLPQCYEYCGTGYGTYDIWSVVSALSSWVIPLFLLLGNVTYAKISFEICGISLGYGVNWLAVISHLLVNPIDFLWSLCLKLDAGQQIKIRCDHVGMPSFWDKKDLSAIAFALDDFENGDHVDTLLKPLERKPKDSMTGVHTDISLELLEERSTRAAHRKAIQAGLGSAARDLADARKHNKLHSTLAILMYGKEVFETLINAKLDGSFPYHMPHTLALRQIYYWLFLAIILGSAAGGFANQWTSHVILKRFLADRRQALEEHRLQEAARGRTFRFQDIDLRPPEPWSGGNYSWKHPKGKLSRRGLYLLVLVLLAVLLPVVSAFCISWFTPTVGLGDRGIMELSYAGFWILNWGLMSFASRLWKDRRSLFRVMWWNMFWAGASLAVLFAAFQGWFNSCTSWAAYYSRGASGAFLDLNMKDTEQNDIFTFYLPVIVSALVIQLGLAGSILQLNKDILKCTVWSDDENRSFADMGTRS